MAKITEELREKMHALGRVSMTEAAKLVGFSSFHITKIAKEEGLDIVYVDGLYFISRLALEKRFPWISAKSAAPVEPVPARKAVSKVTAQDLRDRLRPGDPLRRTDVEISDRVRLQRYAGQIADLTNIVQALRDQLKVQSQQLWDLGNTAHLLQQRLTVAQAELLGRYGED